jgi:hypothetical protein
MWEIRNAYKPESPRTLGRPRYRWENNIKIGPKEAGSKVVDWTQVVLDRA